MSSVSYLLTTLVDTSFPENPIILPIFGFLFSLPCFYIITQMPDYAQAGRFILLTYVSSSPGSADSRISHASTRIIFGRVTCRPLLLLSSAVRPS